mgnify:CR=1 FL=1
MPKQLIILLIIEALLLMGAALLMWQPGFVFGERSPAVRSLYKYLGVALTCLVFCWSFIVGSVLAFYRIEIPYIHEYIKFQVF